MGEGEGLDVEVADGEGGGVGPEREGGEAVAVEVAEAEGFEAAFVDADGDGGLFECAEGVVGDVVGVEVGDEDGAGRRGAGTEVGECGAGAFHGGEAAIEEDCGGGRPEGEAVAGAAAGEGFE